MRGILKFFFRGVAFGAGVVAVGVALAGYAGYRQIKEQRAVVRRIRDTMFPATPFRTKVAVVPLQMGLRGYFEIETIGKNFLLIVPCTADGKCNMVEKIALFPWKDEGEKNGWSYICDHNEVMTCKMRGEVEKIGKFFENKSYLMIFSLDPEAKVRGFEVKGERVVVDGLRVAGLLKKPGPAILEKERREEGQ